MMLLLICIFMAQLIHSIRIFRVDDDDVDLVEFYVYIKNQHKRKKDRIKPMKMCMKWYTRIHLMRVRIMTSYPLQNTDFSSETIVDLYKIETHSDKAEYHSSFAHILRGRHTNPLTIQLTTTATNTLTTCGVFGARLMPKSQLHQNICLKLCVVVHSRYVAQCSFTVNIL